MLNRAVIYSDATGKGMLAWVADLGEGRRMLSSIAVPTWLRKWALFRRTQIATWELVAALCSLWWLLSRNLIDESWEVHLFLDSKTALGTLLRGASRQKDWNSLVGEIWFKIACHGCLLMAWYVPSHQNLADAPTRPRQKQHELEAFQDAGFESTAWQWPKQWLA